MSDALVQAAATILRHVPENVEFWSQRDGGIYIPIRDLIPLRRAYKQAVETRIHGSTPH